MMISSGSSVRGWVLAMSVGATAMVGCASNKASTNNGNGQTAATQKQNNVGTAPQNPTPKPDPAPEPASSQEDALVRVKDKMFPPVDVGAWLCEPKSWADDGKVLLHCTAPAGTTGVVAALKSDPAVAEATEAPK